MSELAEGQYKIGNMIFGANTLLPVQSMEPVSYTIAAGDYPRPLSDEIAMGKDYVQPGQIQMTVGIINNYILDGFWDGQPKPVIAKAEDLLEKFRAEWRADDVRTIWGYQKPLTYRRLGRTRMVYGRPRDIAGGHRRMGVGWYDLTLAYQMSDTFSYSAEQSGIFVPPSADVNVNQGILGRGDGGAPTWMTGFIVGPVTNPVLKIGPYTLTLQTVLGAGQIINFSSYPWERRIVRSDGANLVNSLIGDSPYLNQLKIPEKTTGWTCGLHGSGMTAGTYAIVQWQEAYHSI